MTGFVSKKLGIKTWSFYGRGIENSELTDIRDSLNSDSNIEATERFQYTLYIMSQLSMWENEFYRFKIGLFESDEFEARTVLWRGQISINANVAVWELYQDSFAPDFQIYLNEIIDEIS